MTQADQSDSPKINQTVRTRFAPSPTGFLHVGSVRTALFNYLWAEQHQGHFILRIEDTDRQRSKTEYEEKIIAGLDWLSLQWDEFYRQSERTEIYSEYLQRLLATDLAYISQEEPTQDPTRRPEVIRFRNPNIEITFTDLVRGSVSFDTTELGDFVIARSITEPLYHLSVVVDDGLMEISHVIRAEEHLSNTPRQMLLQRALGLPEPTYVHLPMILAPDRSKLSKRHGAVSVTEFRDRGYLPDALINYLALLGWNPGTDEEIFHLQELIELFDLKQVQKGGAIFDEEKLRWINRVHLGHESEWQLTQAVIDYLGASQRLGQVTVNPKYAALLWRNIFKERVSVYQDITDLAEAGELDYLFFLPQYGPERLSWKDTSSQETIRYLETVLVKLRSLPDNNFTKESIKEVLWDWASEQGRGAVLWPMRLALSGLDKSPDPFTLAETLGQAETVKRLDKAIQLLAEQ